MVLPLPVTLEPTTLRVHLIKYKKSLRVQLVSLVSSQNKCHFLKIEPSTHGLTKDNIDLTMMETLTMKNVALMQTT